MTFVGLAWRHRQLVAGSVSAAGTTGAAASHTLFLGVLSTITLLGVATITGIFQLMASRRNQFFVTPEHEATAETAEAANTALVDELARKESVIARQGAEAVEYLERIADLEERLAAVERPQSPHA